MILYADNHLYRSHQSKTSLCPERPVRIVNFAHPSTHWQQSKDQPFPEPEFITFLICFSSGHLSLLSNYLTLSCGLWSDLFFWVFRTVFANVDKLCHLIGCPWILCHAHAKVPHTIIDVTTTSQPRAETSGRLRRRNLVWISSRTALKWGVSTWDSHQELT